MSDERKTYLAYSLQADTIQAGMSDAPRYRTLPCLTKISRESINSGIEVEWSHFMSATNTRVCQPTDKVDIEDIDLRVNSATGQTCSRRT